jgi:hypothetical protein
MKAGSFALLAVLAGAARVSKHAEEGEVAAEVAAAADRVACPVIASLFSAGHLKPDGHGRVERQEVLRGLMATGASKEAAAFQARIAAYQQDDLHQERRYNGKPTDPAGPKYLNIFTMSRVDQCSSSQSTTTSAGYPCNVNTQFLQHGYSTTLRAPDNGLSSKGYDRFFSVSGVLSNIPGASERVMTAAGLGTLLTSVKTRNGDYSGDQALNKWGSLDGSNMAKFHPSVSSPQKYLPLSEWQANFAWGAFFVAFSKTYRGVEAIPESDLKRMMIDGQFPRNYQMKQWSLRTGLGVVAQFEGQGTGEDMVRHAKDIVNRLGNAPESEYMMALMRLLQGFGIAADDVYNSYRDAIMLNTDA